ncbi:hypothetical protein DPMN_062138 [Dreissena polymorpha]|uniref:Uncharacterized protein n=1 Tax=Dreissena polymorpha TaxID=45954 RepID=A0A9D4C8A3_DREPO|nr:hypothetical protein DPMN_062138 [Dreissena polymorpha]
MTEHLRRLTRQNEPWSWSEEAQSSFDSLKSALLCSSHANAGRKSSMLCESCLDRCRATM